MEAVHLPEHALALGAGLAGGKGISWSMGRLGILEFLDRPATHGLICSLYSIYYSYRPVCFRLPSFKASAEAV